ncbi:helicase-like protein [Trypanosoma cruzi]|nr:helicase-like protein [Trypanosoma cruzi]
MQRRRDEAPATRRGLADGPVARLYTAKDGVPAQSHQTHLLMAGGMPISALRQSPRGQRRPVIPPTSRDNVGGPHFLPSMPLPSFTSPLGNTSCPEEEKRQSSAFDVTMWPLRVWNNGSSGVVFDIRGAYNYWERTEDQTKLSFDPLVDGISEFEAEQDFKDICMKFGKNVLQAFRMHLMMPSDPGIPLSEFVPDFTQPFLKMTPSRGQPSLSWNDEGRSVRCDVNGVKCTGTMHLHATYGAHTNVIF